MKIPAITVHGRFQPPLHINHRNYILDAFNRAEKVIILITNPYLDENTVKEAGHRNTKENNPFTHEERVEIFTKYFNAIGIAPERYEFKPFDITHEDGWDKVLNHSTPNLINVYGDWSRAKVEKFQRKGFEVIRTDNPKEVPISGSSIRNILKEKMSLEDKKRKLISVGYIPEAIDGLFAVIDKSPTN